MSYSISISQEPEFHFIKSIYIPRVFENITIEKIKHTFEILDIGKVSHIDLVQRCNSSQNMAFIHFKQWYTNPGAQNLAKRILDPDQEARLVYDDPWYWILFQNKKQCQQSFVQEDGSAGETIEGLKQQIHEYKMIIDDLESQLFDERERKQVHHSVLPLPLHSCSSMNMDVSSISQNCSETSRDLDWSYDMSWIDENGNEKTIPIKSERFTPELEIMSQKKQHQYLDLELGIKNKQASSLTKIVPINKDLHHLDDVNILIEDNIPSETMFDSKGNRYIKQHGKWFKIEERKIEQHFWCDP